MGRKSKGREGRGRAAGQRSTSEGRPLKRAGVVLVVLAAVTALAVWLLRDPAPGPASERAANADTPAAARLPESFPPPMRGERRPVPNTPTGAEFLAVASELQQKSEYLGAERIEALEKVLESPMLSTGQRQSELASLVQAIFSK